MTRLRSGSLFSGYGGLTLAVEEVFGAETAFVSDIDTGPCKILAHRFPGVPNLGDISHIDWSPWAGKIDLLEGGSPCQDLSTAGRRAGMTDGTRSNLWVMMRHAIAEIRPRFVVWENVRGAYSAQATSAMESDPRLLGDHPAGVPALRALGRVLGDLASLGYDARWCGLRAADVGAAHGRFRVFLLAWDASRVGVEGEWPEGVEVPEAPAGAVYGLTLLPTPTATPYGSNQSASAGAAARPSLDGLVRLLPTPTTQPTTGNGHARDLGSEARLDWQEYAPAIARQEQAFGRPCPPPTQLSSKGKPQLSPRLTEWMMGLPDGWVTDVPDITPNEALKACGNGVVPQQAAAALRHMVNEPTEE